MDFVTMRRSRRAFLGQTLVGAASTLGVSTRAAEPWHPTKPVRLINPFSAGGPSDILARLAANLIGNGLTQPIFVDNRPGALGTIGALAAAASAPDGTTLVAAATDSHCIYPHAYAKPTFNAREQQPIAPLAMVPFCLLVRPDFPARNLAEFLEVARKRQVSYASWGIGSVGHLAGIMIEKGARVNEMLHVPFQGQAPAIQALIAGQVDMMIGAVAMAVTYKDRLRPLAAMTPSRVEVMPDLPTFGESGLPLNAGGAFWIGVFAPPKTPPQTVDVLNRAFTSAVTDPKYKAQLSQLGLVSHVASAEAYTQFFAEDYENWGRFIREQGIKLGQI